MQNQISMLFPTPIGQFRFPDCAEVNRELRTLILGREKSQPSQNRANAGGWHSTDDLLSWPGPAIATVSGWMNESVNQMISATLQMMKAAGMPTRVEAAKLKPIAWANVSRRGNYHRMHNHPGSSWSGVYYVASVLPNEANPLSGLLEIPDPRPHANMVSTPAEPFAQRILMKPEAGSMVLFPGWCQHFVHPFTGDGERISIAFNVAAIVG